MSDPVTLGDMSAFIHAQRSPFRPFAEDLYWAIRDAVDRARSADMPDTTPIANVDRLSTLLSRFQALQAQ